VGQQKLKLKGNHTWTSKPGHAICVLDRGLVRFDYPKNWIVEPGDGAVHLHDRPPSVESCELRVSIFRVPLQYARELSLDEMLLDALRQDREPHEQSEIQRIERGDIEIIWVEQRHIETDCQRDARFRVALARARRSA